MKRFLVLLLAALLLLSACAGADAPVPGGQEEVDTPAETGAPPASPVLVDGLAVPSFSITVNQVEVGRAHMLDYPIYALEAEIGGQLHEFRGFTLSDVLHAAGLSEGYEAVTALSQDGTSLVLSRATVGVRDTLLALYQDGVRFESAPWLVVSDSGGCLSEVSELTAEGAQTARLPAPAPDPADPFGVDCNINIHTIDDWLGREDVAYRDVRMLYDPASYEDIGGDANLTATLEGFRVVPYPYLATLSELPVEGAYNGETLFTLTWDEAGNITSVSSNYAESMQILLDLFPTDRPVFLMCGGGGYAAMTRDLLLYLGWDENLIYNLGAFWEYEGYRQVRMILSPTDREDHTVFATWRVDYALIEFDRLHPSPGGTAVYTYKEYDLAKFCTISDG